MKKQNTWFSRLLGQEPEKTSAEIAEERLRVILVSSANSRIQNRLSPDRIESMKLEIGQVVGKYIGMVQSDDIKIDHRKQDDMDVLELSISLPDH